jgi:hypothetical protein
MSLSDFLTWVLGAGGASLVASWILERIPKYTEIPSSEQKQWIYFGVCLVLSIGSFAIVTYVPKEVLDSIAPWFGLAASVFTSIFIGSGFHKIDKLTK